MMIKPNKHTPGPWAVNPRDPHKILGHFAIPGGDPDGYWTIIVEVTPGQPGSQHIPKQSLANARIIATVPQMVDLIKLARQTFQDAEYWSKAFDDWMISYNAWLEEVAGND